MCERVDEIERMEGGFVVQVKRRASEDDSQKERRGGRWLVSNGHSLMPLHTELRPFESEGKGEREEKGERCKDG